jgi:mercuric ion transport protein
MFEQQTSVESTVPGCACKAGAQRTARTVRWSAGAGLLAAIGACGACCLLPTALLALGAGSSWIALLGALEPYQGWLAALAGALLAAGFYAAYRPRVASCGPGTDCTPPPPSRTLKAVLWIAAALAVTGIGAEWFLRLALGTAPT